MLVTIEVAYKYRGTQLDNETVSVVSYDFICFRYYIHHVALLSKFKRYDVAINVLIIVISLQLRSLIDAILP